MNKKTPWAKGSNFRSRFAKLGEFPLMSYWRWSRYTRGSYKKMWKGLLKILKGIVYILIFLYSVNELLDISIGMRVLVILIGLKGAFNIAKGIHLTNKARRIAEKSRGERGKRRWKYFLLWTNSTFLIGLISLSFLFIIEQLKAPQEIRGDQSWYFWPLIYFTIWLVWSIVTRSMVLGGARAFKVGDRLAKVHHDQRMLKETIRSKRNKRAIMATVYIPLIGLGLMMVLIIFLKLLLRLFLRIVFDIENATSIGEGILRLAFGPNLSLSDMAPFFGTWYGPLLMYLGVVVLICLFAYLRSFAMIRAHFRDRYHSYLGKRVELVKELKRSLK